AGQTLAVVVLPDHRAAVPVEDHHDARVPPSAMPALFTRRRVRRQLVLVDPCGHHAVCSTTASLVGGRIVARVEEDEADLGLHPGLNLYLCDSPGLDSRSDSSRSAEVRASRGVEPFALRLTRPPRAGGRAGLSRWLPAAGQETASHPRSRGGRYFLRKRKS